MAFYGIIVMYFVGSAVNGTVLLVIYGIFCSILIELRILKRKFENLIFKSIRNHKSNNSDIGII
jgi:hypothetical protein